MTREATPRFLYIFLDEAGNLDFSRNGTKYFVLGGITKERPFHAYKELTEFKYDQVERGTALEYFHASENAQAVRNGVFDIIEKNLAGVSVDAIIVEKQRLEAEFRAEEQLFPKVLGTLLREILQHYPLPEFGEVIVFTDSLPGTAQARGGGKGREDDPRGHASGCGALPHLASCLEIERGPPDRGLLHLGDLPEMEWQRSAFVHPGAGSRSPRMGRTPGRNGISRLKMKTRKNDHPGYSYERTQWVLVTGVEPLSHNGQGLSPRGRKGRTHSSRYGEYTPRSGFVNHKSLFEGAH